MHFDGGISFLLAYYAMKSAKNNTVKIAIQGTVGSFHDIAAHQFFASDEIETICCDTFEEVFSAMHAQPNECLGLVAIENTIAGSLLHNYELLRDNGSHIVGEYKLHIEHALLCLPDDDWNTLKEVHSHPVALMQCRNYLRGHRQLRVMEASDTAGAAENIARGGLRGHAAICHAGAAQLYGMKVLERSIEDNKHNFTRFLLLTDLCCRTVKEPFGHPDKASVVFALPHEEGSLAQVLAILSFYKINLTKIQSLPIIGCEWEYLFYVDLQYDDHHRYLQGIDAVRPLTRDLRILGEYQAAR